MGGTKTGSSYKDLSLMIIDLTRLPDDAELSEALDDDWWRGGEQDEQVLALDAPLQVAVRVRRAGNKYLLDGKVTGGILIRCDRCLEPYHHDLAARFNLYLQVRPSPEAGSADVELLDDDMEVEFISGEEVNLDGIIREQVFLSLPMKCVCQENCLGLCPVCGGNLNTGQCQCQRKTGHPAFLKLKNLKIQNPEVNNGST